MSILLKAWLILSLIALGLELQNLLIGKKSQMVKSRYSGNKLATFIASLGYVLIGFHLLATGLVLTILGTVITYGKDEALNLIEGLVESW